MFHILNCKVTRLCQTDLFSVHKIQIGERSPAGVCQYPNTESIIGIPTCLVNFRNPSLQCFRRVEYCYVARGGRSFECRVAGLQMITGSRDSRGGGVGSYPPAGRGYGNSPGGAGLIMTPTWIQGAKSTLGRFHESMAFSLLQSNETQWQRTDVSKPSWIQGVSGAFDPSRAPTGAAGLLWHPRGDISQCPSPLNTLEYFVYAHRFSICEKH